MIDKIFAKKSPPRQDAAPSPAELAADIAAGVRRPGQHQILEHRLAALRDRRAPLRERFMALTQADITAMSEGQRAKAFAALETEERKLGAEIIETRLDLAPYRSEHGERVTQALQQMRSDAARRFLAAAAEIEAAVVAMNACNGEIRRASGDAPSWRLPEEFHDCKRAARRLLKR